MHDGWESNPQPPDHESDALTAEPRCFTNSTQFNPTNSVGLGEWKQIYKKKKKKEKKKNNNNNIAKVLSISEKSISNLLIISATIKIATTMTTTAKKTNPNNSSKGISKLHINSVTTLKQRQHQYLICNLSNNNNKNNKNNNSNIISRLFTISATVHPGLVNASRCS
ncbi:hypothetical protein ElyMa_002984100 [Elysia marginata]|uniref:Uncharacterized protein n=1 Tax=Elysia marginata TaxID=1093978 RepID=A0AAV4ICQ5_9GAST|nr:hypothetical protein ElyMa_002984100 [Elysia marginata]